VLAAEDKFALHIDAVDLKYRFGNAGGGAVHSTNASQQSASPLDHLRATSREAAAFHLKPAAPVVGR
jgi:hypothetical protein